MKKGSKLIYIIGSLIIGVVGVLSVCIGLIVSGAMTGSSDGIDIVFSSVTAEKVYDGTELTAEEWEISSGALQTGHKAQVVVSGSQTSAGASPNHLTAKIFDASGKDVTGSYDIQYQPGLLTVSKQKLELQSSSASKEYDGEPLVKEEYTLLTGTLAKGHTLSMIYSVELTDVGEADNVIAANVFDVNANDVTANYELVYHTGKLTVTPRMLEIVTSGEHKEYDGTPLTCSDWDWLDNRLLEGHSAEIRCIFTGCYGVGAAGNNGHGVGG